MKGSIDENSDSKGGTDVVEKSLFREVFGAVGLSRLADVAALVVLVAVGFGVIWYSWKAFSEFLIKNMLEIEVRIISKTARAGDRVTFERMNISLPLDDELKVRTTADLDQFRQFQPLKLILEPVAGGATEPLATLYLRDAPKILIVCHVREILLDGQKLETKK